MIHNDKPSAEVIAVADKLIAQGAIVRVKWTCPGCGERAVSDIPNSFNTKGYTHTEKADGSVCGVHYDGDLYGLEAMIPVGLPSRPQDN